MPGHVAQQPSVRELLEAELEQLHSASYGWALALCRHDADDAAEVLQQTYLKVLAQPGRFEGRSSLRTWLFGVIRRTATEHYRFALLRRLRLDRLFAAEPARPPDLDAAVAAQERTQLLAAALDSLAARQREVLHLVFYQELTIEEAAAVMGVALGTARLHYERGKKNLRARLAAKGVSWG